MIVSITYPDGSLQDKHFGDVLMAFPYTVLYFYPKDNTSGCTLEAQEFSALSSDFSSLGAQIIAVSKDSHASHCRFITKHDILFPLISDPEWVLHKQFGAVGEKSLYGRTYVGTIRSTYILDTTGTILQQWIKVQAKGHAAQVLSALQNLSS